MFTTLMLMSAMAGPGVPVPKVAPPSGQAPRVVEIKPNQEGKLLVSIRRSETIAINRPAGANPGLPVERTVYKTMQVELADIKELKITTAGGKSVDMDEALSQLKDGGIVVMTSDGKPVDPAFLRIFKSETLVFSSPELVQTNTFNSTAAIRVLPAILPPAPAPAPAVQPPAAQPLPKSDK